MNLRQKASEISDLRRKAADKAFSNILETACGDCNHYTYSDMMMILELICFKGFVVSLKTFMNQKGAGHFLTEIYPLQLAIQGDRYELFNDLCNFGADINAKDKYGHTPLMLACMFGRTEIAKKLIELGANLYEKDVDDMSIADHIFQLDNDDLTAVFCAKRYTYRELLTKKYNFLSQKSPDDPSLIDLLQMIKNA